MFRGPRIGGRDLGSCAYDGNLKCSAKSRQACGLPDDPSSSCSMLDLAAEYAVVPLIAVAMGPHPPSANAGAVDETTVTRIAMPDTAVDSLFMISNPGFATLILENGVPAVSHRPELS